MKKRLPMVAAAVVLLAACTTRNPSPEGIISQVKENYEKHASMAYAIHYRTKYFSDKDTISLNASCKLVRDSADKLFGGHVWFVANDTIECYYNLSNIYRIDRSTKKMIACAAKEENTYLLTGNTAGSVMDVGFLRPGRMLKAVKDSTNKVSMVEDEDYFTITIRYPDQEGSSESEMRYRIKKNDFVIDQITYKTKFQGDYQYNEWNLSSIEFDKVSVADLDQKMEEYKKSYTRETYPPVEIPILAAGAVAPSFTGTQFQTGKAVSLNDYKGKIVVLDFSYMTCYPCIMAIPHLNNIQSAYKNKEVVVLSVNSKETAEEYKEQMTNFISKNSVGFPVILTSGKTDSVYQVTGYPTIYVIGKKGKIVYSELGASEVLEDSLKAVIGRQ